MEHKDAEGEDSLSVGSLVVKHQPTLGSVNPLATPIYPTTTYLLDNAAHGAELSGRGADIEDVSPEQSPYLYSRWANPTNEVAATIIKKLEGGKRAYMFSSGMAAISSAVFSFLKAGDHCVAQTPVYGGTHEVFTLLETFGVQVTRVKLSEDGSVDNFKEAIRTNTKLLYAESPANPICRILDLQAFGSLGKDNEMVTMVDSTFASPINQSPIKECGVKVVIHSCTKYIGGHSDVTAGVVVCATKELGAKVWQTRKLFGGVLSPYEGFLIVRGLKTMKLRVDAQNANALYLAQWLEKHPEVAKVHYPGLPSHPGHAVALRTMHGFGGMLSFELKKGELAGRKVVESVKLINHAVSLGGVESLISHAASTTHIMVPREVRLEGGITDGLIRLSVGIEDKEDLRKDLERALSLLADL